MSASDRTERVREAISSLTDDEILRLHEWAKYLIFVRLARRATTEDHEDLYMEAILKTLSGERCWPPANAPNLSLYLFLHETMRSIAHNWAKRGRYIYRDSELAAADGDSGEPRSVLDGLPCADASVEDHIVNDDLLARISARVGRSGDEKTIIASWLRGMTIIDIQRVFRFTRTKCETTLRRLRRNVSAIREELL
ncbi:MAG: hypothetical protein HY296_08360 [Thaumarchaeota archaeon]|nr:hypothetical protein [Nitrososphaerota archaeon]